MSIGTANFFFDIDDLEQDDNEMIATLRQGTLRTRLGCERISESFDIHTISHNSVADGDGVDHKIAFPTYVDSTLVDFYANAAQID
jgi:hypothetical protein